VSFETIGFEKRAGVAIVTLDRPERLNAIDNRMARELSRAWREIKADPEIAVVILTGRGDRALSTGFDVGAVASGEADVPSLQLTALQTRCWKPVITAVNGMVSGGGLHFVADSDLVIAAEHATFFDTHVNVGLVAGMEPIVLARRIPLEPVLRMSIAGKADRVDAKRALELGLIGEIVPKDRLMARALELAEAIKACSIDAVMSSKQAIWESLSRPIEREPDRGGEEKTMASYETLRIERDGKVATLTLNRPERLNAFDRQMRDELPRAWAEIANDPEIWVVIFTGAGDRAFSAGMDLKEPPPKVEAGGTLPRVRITALDCGVMKPVIAAVNGVCAGGGLAFVADSDIVISSDDATFTDGRTSAGQVSIHGTLRLARKIPLESVFRLVMLGRAEKMTAARAKEIGMVSEIVPKAELMKRARALAATIAENSPNAIFETKRTIMRSLELGLDRALEEGWETVTRFARDSQDPIEGARAFTEKRKPAWKFGPPSA
jgi:(E)-benzylidenesuccinyl-CoA hydratase